MGEKDKTCFVASTIGEEGSDDRKKADDKYDFVFEPVLEEQGYETIRADKLATPNSISTDIVKQIINSDLMIADVSDKNPNVFYELGIRNAIQKPVIVIREVKQQLPFDIYDKRAISIDMKDPRNWTDAKDELKKQVIASEKDKESASKSILSDFSLTTKLDAQLNPDVEIALQLKDLQYELRRLRNESRRGVTNNPRGSSDYVVRESRRYVEITMMKDSMEILKSLEGYKKEPVSKFEWMEAMALRHICSISDANKLISKLLREAAIYQSKPGWYNTV